jgi:2-oxoglutarate dehydrogenase E2 component (dihydrolipoamide succinyltransferase)
MKQNIVAPSVGESITEVSILKWAKSNGAFVKQGELLLEIESDKATVELVAEASGVLNIMKQPGERVPVGSVIGMIDTDAKVSASTAAAPPPPIPTNSAGKPPPVPGGPGLAAPTMAPPMDPIPAPPPNPMSPATSAPPAIPGSSAPLSPSVRKMVAEQGINVSQVPGTGKDGRVTKGDLMGIPATPSSPQRTLSPVPSISPTPAPSYAPAPAQTVAKQPDRPGDRRVKMSMLRQRIAERLVQAQHTAAILTTFNEADMGPVMQLRNKHKDAFKAKHGVGLSFMSFFTAASIEALKVVPEVNASMDGNEIVYHDYFDIGIAVGTERGLVVPVIRNVEKMGFVQMEKAIAELAIKARDGKLSLAELTGGTFTISNGGTYGSLMSTPILNPPQSGILGMHKIQERPMAVNGKVEIRPMMYLALSYDHRIIDGKGAVTFLVTLKDFIEHPEKLKLEF